MRTFNNFDRLSRIVAGWIIIFAFLLAHCHVVSAQAKVLPTDNVVTDDGYNPWAGLTLGRDGNFYGTTYHGGNTGYGTVFQVTIDGAVATLTNFNGTNGSNPAAALVQGRDGNFYGTTVNGGSKFHGGDSGGGKVFKVTPTGVLTTLVSFNGSNGLAPAAALVFGHDGSLYGTTSGGGGNAGTVFKITPSGTLTTLVDFGKSPGSNPTSALLQVRDGNFYGTTESGGGNEGTIFNMMR